MRTASLPYSIARSLSAGAIEPNYAPDGLDEAAIDALIEEASTEVADVPRRPAWAAPDVAEQRRVRRRIRRLVRALPDVLAAPETPGESADGQVA
jgi:hypothetical protein